MGPGTALEIVARAQTQNMRYDITEYDSLCDVAGKWLPWPCVFYLVPSTNRSHEEGNVVSG